MESDTKKSTKPTINQGNYQKGITKKATEKLIREQRRETRMKRKRQIK